MLFDGINPIFMENCPVFIVIDKRAYAVKSE
jgi:hypothetical protein